MPIEDDLRDALEQEERETVGSAFGGTEQATRKSYSVAKTRDFLLARLPIAPNGVFDQALIRMQDSVSQRLLRIALGSIIRFSFLVELTNLKVGSTKMKTRWLPGRILMPQAHSFEPVQGTFEPGNDPRSASFADCLAVFVHAANTLCDQIDGDASLTDDLVELNRLRRVPYEFPLGYASPVREPLHRADNLAWIFNADTVWLLRARSILGEVTADRAVAMEKIIEAKLEVKVFRTDRALTGKDKTNRAKRWEVLAGDFQHATLADCWSAERKLTRDLVGFEAFPQRLRERFIQEDLFPADARTTRCPVTREILHFDRLATAVLDPTHGVSQYQIGHLHPLKRQGRHDGANVCWQSADGNRIQGHLSIDDTDRLLDEIAERRTPLENLRVRT